MATLKHLRAWQIGVIVVAIVAGAVGAYYLVNLRNSDDQAGAGLADNEQLVVVERGNLINQVQTRGTLTLPRRKSIHLGADSVVKDVFVEEGQAVVEGQTLFTLDDATVVRHDLAVARARISLRDAQKARDNLLRDSEAGLIEAQTMAREAERNLANVETDHAAKVEFARKDLKQKEDDYRNIYSAWFGVSIPVDQMDLSPQQLLKQWNLDLDWLFSPEGAFFSSGGVPWNATPADDPATVWSEPIVFNITNFYPGGIVGTCEETREHPLNGHCLQKGFDDAWEELKQARRGMDDALAARDYEVYQAQLALDKAKANTAEATIAVQDAGNGEKGYSRALTEAELRSAETALKTALEQRESATKRAPIDGIVSNLKVVAGQPLEEGVGAAVEIIDTSIVELAGQVDETEILRISHGQEALITLDALPGQAFTGEILSISSGAELQQGIAVFSVKIRIQAPRDVGLREGMNADARMAIEEEKDVLLVPVPSIYGTLESPIVRVMQDGKITPRPVTLGSNDAFWVVVITGVDEGDEVVMNVPERNDFFSFSGDRS